MAIGQYGAYGIHPTHSFTTTKQVHNNIQDEAEITSSSLAEKQYEQHTKTTVQLSETTENENDRQKKRQRNALSSSFL